jgi:cellobiose phosphorylase
VRPDWDGLRIEPCVPPAWKGFRMTRRFRGATYRITVRRGERSGISVDGRPLRSAVVPAFADGRVHEVDAVIPRG